MLPATFMANLRHRFQSRNLRRIGKEVEQRKAEREAQWSYHSRWFGVAQGNTRQRRRSRQTRSSLLAGSRQPGCIPKYLGSKNKQVGPAADWCITTRSISEGQYRRSLTCVSGCDCLPSYLSRCRFHHNDNHFISSSGINRFFI